MLSAHRWAVDLDDFWNFIRERHEMFRRRRYLRQPPPWTADQHLNSFHVTEIYGELDRGTRYLMVNVLPSHPSPEVVLWRALMYRVLNNIDTYEALAAVGFTDPDTCNRDEAVRVLREREAQGLTICQGAYEIRDIDTAAREARDRREPKVEMIVRRLVETAATLPQLYADLVAAPSMRDAYTRLVQLPGVGDVVAYELVVSLCYRGLLDGTSILPFGEDDFVSIGPGARLGLREFGFRSSPEGMYALRDEQPDDLPGPRLTVRNVEHALCAYSKASRMRRGDHPERLYRPRPATPEDDVLWPKELVKAYLKPELRRVAKR